MSKKIQIPSPAKLREQFDLRARRGIGQHFLTNGSILGRIADKVAILEDSTTIYEVGMGPGYLTAQLLHREPRHLLALEMDDRFRPLHEQLFGDREELQVHYSDALDQDFAQLLPPTADLSDVVLCGNIPYQITSPLLFKIWRGPLHFRKVVLMVQKEVANRLVSPPGSKTYGLLSVKAQYFSEVKIEFGVERTRFRPAPRVDSALVSLKPYTELCYSRERQERFFALLDGAFAQRRKTIVNSLVGSPPFPIDKEQLLAALQGAGIESGRRAETVSLAEFHQLFERVEQLQ